MALEVGVSFYLLISVGNFHCESPRVNKGVTHNVLFRSLYDSGTACIPLVKAVNASGRIDQLLLAGEKRVTLGADFYMQLFAHRRTRHKRMTACTANFYFVVFRMYLWFHNLTSLAVYI